MPKKGSNFFHLLIDRTTDTAAFQAKMNTYLASVPQMEQEALTALFVDAVWCGQIPPKKHEHYCEVFEAAKQLPRVPQFLDAFSKKLYDPEKRILLFTWMMNRQTAVDIFDEIGAAIKELSPQALCAYADHFNPFFHDEKDILGMMYRQVDMKPQMRLAMLTSFQGQACVKSLYDYIAILADDHPPSSKEKSSFQLNSPYNKPAYEVLLKISINSKNSFEKGEIVIYSGRGNLSREQRSLWLGCVTGTDGSGSFLVAQRFNPKKTEWEDPIPLRPFFIGKLP